MLTKDKILAADDLPREKVECWGDFVYVRTLTAAERDRWEIRCEDLKTKGLLSNVRASLLVLVLCDDTGKLLFTENDALELGKKSGKVLDELFDVARRLNGIGQEQVEAAKKNSPEASGESSS